MKREDVINLLKSKAEVIVYNELSSSNTEAKRLAKAGASEFTSVIALTQTSGKGRLGRSFISNSENGLYMSMILYPTLSPNKCVDITAMAAVAVLESIKSTAGVDAQIKWVNDVYVDDRKICGILTESSINSEGFDYVICGIGVNITPPAGGFDDSIKDIAGAIFLKESPKCYKELLCASIIDNLIKYYADIENKTYIKIYRESSNIIGKNVDVYIGNEIIGGRVVDINDMAELVVKKENGEICVFNSGEARVRKRA